MNGLNQSDRIEMANLPEEPCLVGTLVGCRFFVRPCRQHERLVLEPGSVEKFCSDFYSFFGLLPSTISGSVFHKIFNIDINNSNFFPRLALDESWHSSQ